MVLNIPACVLAAASSPPAAIAPPATEPTAETPAATANPAPHPSNMSDISFHREMRDPDHPTVLGCFSNARQGGATVKDRGIEDHGAVFLTLNEHDFLPHAVFVFVTVTLHQVEEIFIVRLVQPFPGRHASPSGFDVLEKACSVIVFGVLGQKDDAGIFAGEKIRMDDGS